MKAELHFKPASATRIPSPPGSLLKKPCSFIELLPVAIYACDAAGRILWFNQRAAELWGRAPRIGDDSELFCGSHKLHLGGRQIRRDETPMAIALRTGNPTHGAEALLERPDGSLVWATVHIDPVKDDSGAVIGAINCFTDTSALHQARTEVSERDAHMHRLLDAMPVAVYTTDQHGRLTYFNKAAVEFAGRTPELGRDHWSVSWKLHHADGSPMRHDECPMADALRQGRAFDGELDAIEVIAERPDGTRRWFMPYPTPLHDRHGKLIGGINILLDITRRKRNELLLAEQNAVLELAARGCGLPRCLDALTASVARLDPGSRACVLLSDARRESFANAYSASLPNAFGSNVRGASIEELAIGTCGTAVWSGEPVTCADVEHDSRWAQSWRELCLAHGIHAVHSTPILDEHGHGIGSFMLAFAHAGTPNGWHLRIAAFGAHVASIAIAKCRAEQALIELNASLERRVSERTAELEDSERELRRVASMLSMAEHAERRRISQILHDDLQQQLHSIQMKLAAARAAIEHGDRDASIRHLDTAEAWCGEGVEITRRLTVDLSPPIMKSEGLVEALEWLVTQMREMHGLAVDVSRDRELPRPDGATRVLIYQIVRELLFNIVKHAGTERGRIELRRRDDMLDVCVLDHGNGFDPAAARHPRAGRAGGFGMASAGERLAMLGGSMEIDSTPGLGTRVVLHVPVVACQAEFEPGSAGVSVQ